LRLQKIPDPIASILAHGRGARSEADRIALTTHYLTNQIRERLSTLPAPAMVYAASKEFPPEGNFKPA
jgi:hypothetical protein